MPPRDAPLVTKRTIVAGLRELGLEAADVVLMHASVKAIGWIVGGPQTVLKAIFDVLAGRGTLMMAAGWNGHPYELDQWPEDEQRQAYDEWPAFDLYRSPTDHRRMGILAEYLRSWPGSARSNHPMLSFVAVGPKARWLTEIHPLHYGMGEGSPLGRLCEANGKVLVLGAPLSAITLFHHAEHRVELPAKRIDRYRMPVTEKGKRSWVFVEEFDTAHGIADFGVDDYFTAMAEGFLATGGARSATIGRAHAHLMPAAGLRDFAVAWMREKYAPSP